MTLNLKSLLVVLATLALSLTTSARMHGGPPPPWYVDPTSTTGTCFNPDPAQVIVWDYGTQRLMPFSSWYYDINTEWYPYQVLNGHGTPVPDPCYGVPTQGYAAAGNIGESYSMSVRRQSSGVGVPLPEDGLAWTTWADDWSMPYYSPFGWTMLAGNVIDTWVYTAQEKTYVNGQFFGWQRTGTWPDDPALVGQQIFYQSFVHDAASGVTAFSAPWHLTFADPTTL